MTNTPQRKLRIQTYIEKLQQGVDLPSHGYPRFFLETPTCEIEDPETGSLNTVDKPLLPKELEHVHLDNTHGIVLPNSNRLFYCTSSVTDLIEILRHDIATEIFIASSWQDLYESGYKFWPFIFEAQGVRPTVSGNQQHLRCRFSELLPGDIVGEVFPFCVFSGDISPPWPVTQDILNKHVPLLPKIGAASEVDPSLYHIFFVSNFGINFNGASHISLKDGAQWWSSIDFPGRDIVSRRISEYDTTPFTGVILIPVENGAITREARQSSLQKAETRIKRLRTILDVVENATITILGNIEIVKDINDGVLNSNISIYMNMPYHHFSKKEWIRNSYYEKQILINAANLAFSSPSSKSLDGYIHKSIDSLDLARSVTDKAISHMLIWAAIESLLSPSDHSELISNITLALIGLQNKSIDRLKLWDETKKSYTVRSRIVHSFDLPSPQVLDGALSFSEAHCGDIIRYAISEGQGNQLSRDVMISNLRKKALS